MNHFIQYLNEFYGKNVFARTMCGNPLYGIHSLFSLRNRPLSRSLVSDPGCRVRDKGLSHNPGV